MPCSVQGNRFERRLPILYSQRAWNQGKAPDLSVGYQRFFKSGNGSRPNALAIFRQSCPPIPGIRNNSAVGRCCISPTTSYPLMFSSRRSDGLSFKSASFVSMSAIKSRLARNAQLLNYTRGACACRTLVQPIKGKGLRPQVSLPLS
ncbi:hypothetical protein GOC21_22570 [Sinorhizobium meliloti]|nr:hypothetical protein [Sinorhizobium meliloti]